MQPCRAQLKLFYMYLNPYVTRWIRRLDVDANVHSILPQWTPLSVMIGVRVHWNDAGVRLCCVVLCPGKQRQFYQQVGDAKWKMDDVCAWWIVSQLGWGLWSNRVIVEQITYIFHIHFMMKMTVSVRRCHWFCALHRWAKTGFRGRARESKVDALWNEVCGPTSTWTPSRLLCKPKHCCLKNIFIFNIVI